MIMVLPFGLEEFLLVDWSSLPNKAWLSLGYIIIGTTFTDIRYLGSIERDKTHQKNVTIAMIQNEKSSPKLR